MFVTGDRPLIARSLNHVNKICRFAALGLIALFAVAAPAFAQPAEGEAPAATGAPGSTAAAAKAPRPFEFSGAFGAALVTIGAAYGIGKLASSALESMARQPEVASQIQTAMIIAAALIEGFTFFALFICMQQNPF